MNGRSLTVLVLTVLLVVTPASVGAVDAFSPAPTAETERTGPLHERSPSDGDVVAQVDEDENATGPGVSFTAPNATNGSTYEYEVAAFETVTDFRIDVTGTTTSEWDNETGVNVEPGSTTEIAPAGNVDPGGPADGAPELVVTGSTRTNAPFSDRDEIRQFTAGESAEFGFEDPPNNLTSFTVSYAFARGTPVVDVRVVEERPDGTAGEGTLIASNVSLSSGSDTFDLDGYGHTSDWITVELVARGGSGFRNVATMDHHEVRFVAGGVSYRETPNAELRSEPTGLSISSDDGTNHTFGTFRDGETKTAAFPISTNASRLDFSATGGVYDYTLHLRARAGTVDPTVSVNGHATGYTGRLADGETVSLTTDPSWIRRGTNQVTVTVGGEASADGPEPGVGLAYSHDVQLSTTPTPTSTPDDGNTGGGSSDNDDSSSDSDDDNDSSSDSNDDNDNDGSSSDDDDNDDSSSDSDDDNDSSSGGGGGGGAGVADDSDDGASGGGASGASSASRTTEPPTATATPTPEATTGDGATPARLDDTAVVDVSFEQETIPTSEAAIVVVTVQNPHETPDTHVVELEMFGEVINSREVTVPADGETTVRFEHNIVAPGTYTARVDGETATLRVLEPGETPSPQPTTSTTFPGFEPVAVVLALALALVFGVRRARRR
ncbi:hypothetical protein [Salinigranum salinum]|uniref:hypothetical protein n=1 Tax=Salinigranum salinum TaxID=1364937 RepID=UPI00126063B4|nr:hypothetical protein [Salinigranum salinum]